MRNRLKVLVALGLAALLTLGLVAPSSAGARPAAIRITGGSSTLTTAPGLVGKLLSAKIVSFVTAPGTQTLKPSKTGGTLVATYPISRSTLTKSLGGVVRHRGGLVINNVGNNTSAAVDGFQLDLAHKVLTARLVPTKNRATIFTVNTQHLKVKNPTKHLTIVSGLVLSLDKNAALLLDNVLKTTAFKPGMKFGTAVSRLRH